MNKNELQKTIDKIKDDTILKAKGLELILPYSPDDNRYYFQRLDNWQVSQLFDSKEAAIIALAYGGLLWKD